MHESDTNTIAIVDELIGEYLEATDRHDRPDIAGLLDRAGEHREELQRWIFAHRAVQRVSESLEPVEEPAEKPNEPIAVEAPVGNRFDQYTNKIAIGEGGMSQVYKARDGLLQRTVALKVLKSESLPSPDAWLLEARALAQLDHPNVVRVHDADVVDGQPYLAMEYVDGWSLHRVLRALSNREEEDDADLAALALRLQSQRALLDLALQLTRALTTCHDHGILHRDLKPHNVLVTREGVAKLVDFGLAHYGKNKGGSKGHLVTDRLYGTPAYLAPEQMQSGQTGQNVRTDIYGLGLVLYELFSLQRPPRARLSAPEAPPRIEKAPLELNLIIAHCLEARAADRYERAAALLEDLERVRDRKPPIHVPITLRRRSTLFASRHKGMLSAAGIVLVLGAGWGFKAWSDYDGARNDWANALSSIELNGTVTGADPITAATALHAFRAREAEGALLDERFWSAFYSAALPQRLEQALDRASIWTGDKLRAEEDAGAGHVWIRNDWLHAAKELAGYETEFGARTLVEGALSRPGTYFFDIPASFPNSSSGLEVWAQAWVQLENKVDVPVGALEISTDLEPGEHLGFTPVNAGSEHPVRYALAGRFPPKRQYRITFISRAQSEEFYEVDLQAFGGSWPKSARISQPMLGNLEKIASGSLEMIQIRAGGGDEIVEESVTYQVEPFWTQPSPVTWGQFREFRNTREAQLEFPELVSEYMWLETDESFDDQPALVQWWLASAYARWHGARLPTLFEALQTRAAEPDLATLPEEVEPRVFPRTRVNGEWVADISPAFHEVFRYVYGEHRQHAQSDSMGGKNYYFMKFGVAPLDGTQIPGGQDTLVYQGNPMLFRCVRSVTPTIH